MKKRREMSGLLDAACTIAKDYLDRLPSRPVFPRTDLDTLRAALGRHLREEGRDPLETLRGLAAAADPGLVASSGPRYFGFVTGGSLPVTLGADWLTSVWDQNAFSYVGSPSAAVVEEVAARWTLEALGLPEGASVGLVTGGQMANFTALAAARNAVLAREDWDVEERGLTGAPAVQLVAGAEAHVTILNALRMLGFGTGRVETAEADAQGRMSPSSLARVLDARSGPAIVCAQAGNVNTGSFDPFDEIASIAKRRGAWLHVDGAFGLWAAASPSHRHLLRGVEQADSWATDAHKWLNVPYDSGIAIVRDPAPHLRAMSVQASYLVGAPTGRTEPRDRVPEASRRARAFPLYAALDHLGRKGLADLVEHCCARAREMADRLAAEPGVEILNDVVLNQVLVRFRRDAGSSDELTRTVIERIQNEGICWAGGTTWRGAAAMRISISNWSTSREDVERSAEAILAAFHEESS